MGERIAERERERARKSGEVRERERRRARKSSEKREHVCVVEGGVWVYAIR